MKTFEIDNIENGKQILRSDNMKTLLSRIILSMPEIYVKSITSIKEIKIDHIVDVNKMVK